MVTGSDSTAIRQLFSYDADGKLVSIDYSSDNGVSYTTYHYLRNAQNDVVKLIDESGNTVVQYTYDSWGKPIATTGTLATSLGANQPFRYRGYVYDTETGWYYLQSRYYDPTTCRFISADVLLSTGQGVLGHNAFAYCLNNPILFVDYQGYSVTIVIGGVTITLGVLVAVAFLLVGLFDLVINGEDSLPSRLVIGLVEAIELIIYRVQTLARSLAKSMEGTKKYRHPTEEHHIVPKRDWRAAPARRILEILGIDIDDRINKVTLKTGFHKRLNTTSYNVLIVTGITLAYESGNTYDEKKAAVISFLSTMGGILAAAFDIAPF